MQCDEGYKKVKKVEPGDDDQNEYQKVGCCNTASSNGHDNLYSSYQCELQTQCCATFAIAPNHLSKHGKNNSCSEQDMTSREEKQTI